MPKERTTINIDPDLVEEVRQSGVRNMSKHIEGLLRKDLRGVEVVGKREQVKVQRLQEQLESVEREWFAYLKRCGEA